MIETGMVLGVISIESSARAPEVARKWVTGVYSRRCLGDDYVARTVVTELVTNVHKHTDAKRVSVRLLLDDGLLVEVEDGSSVLPVVQDWDDTAESGRGLLMLGALVREWGVRPLADGGKVTWARLGE